MESLKKIKEDAYSSGAEVDWELENNWQEYLINMGITEEEYWADEEIIEVY